MSERLGARLGAPGALTSSKNFLWKGRPVTTAPRDSGSIAVRPAEQRDCGGEGGDAAL